MLTLPVPTLSNKLCRRCGVHKPTSDFFARGGKKSGVRHICKTCERDRWREWYATPTGQEARRRHRRRDYVTHRSARMQYAVDYSRKIRTKFAAIIRDAKSAGCLTCGERDEACLSFHHTDPRVKDKSVSELAAKTADAPRLVAEIRKCVVLCENCHRRLHAGRFVLLLNK